MKKNEDFGLFSVPSMQLDGDIGCLSLFMARNGEGECVTPSLQRRNDVGLRMILELVLDQIQLGLELLLTELTYPLHYPTST